MKTRGNLTIDDSIITLAGVSVGGYADRSMLKEAKQKVAATIPNPKTQGLRILTPINKPATTGNTVMMAPKMNEESMSPRKIVQMEIGEDMSLSNVLALASQGTMAGPTEVAVKKVVIPRSPGMRASAGMFRPT
jgi:hypothetical protein